MNNNAGSQSLHRIAGLAARGLSCGIVVLLIVFASPLAAQTQPSPGLPGGDEAIANSVEVKPAADDAAIARRIQRILLSTGWFQNPQVSVRDGIVFLDGLTDAQVHSAWASALAQKTEGTVAVVNRISVEADLGSTFSRVVSEVTKAYRQALQVWPWVLTAAAILFVTWLLARAVAYGFRRVLAKRIASPLLLGIFVRLVSVPVFLLGFYFVLQVAGLTSLALTLLGGTGLVGIVVGFALRDIAENFFSSVLLSVRNPFVTGDLIEVAGNTGIVQNLNTRSTVLLTLDGTYIQIPNAIVFKSTIRNYSGASSRRAEFAVGIGYDSSTTKAQALIANVLKEHPAVLDVPEPLVLVEELGMATVNLRIYYWFVTATYSPMKINSALLRLTKDALLGGGIELPDAAREVVFPKGVPIVQMADENDAPAMRREDVAPVEAQPGDGRTATIGEGGLRNEVDEVEEQSSGRVPEATENLLKNRVA